MRGRREDLENEMRRRLYELLFSASRVQEIPAAFGLPRIEERRGRDDLWASRLLVDSSDEVCHVVTVVFGAQRVLVETAAFDLWSPFKRLGKILNADDTWETVKPRLFRPSDVAVDRKEMAAASLNAWFLDPERFVALCRAAPSCGDIDPEWRWHNVGHAFSDGHGLLVVNWSHPASWDGGQSQAIIFAAYRRLARRLDQERFLARAEAGFRSRDAPEDGPPRRPSSPYDTVWLDDLP
jgi:hypothetical protein